MTVHNRRSFRPVCMALLAGALAIILSRSAGTHTSQPPRSELSLGYELTLTEFGFTGTFTRRAGETVWTGSWRGGCANTTFRLAEAPSFNVEGLNPAGQTIVLLREDGDQETCPFSPGLRAEYHLKAFLSGTMVRLEGKRTITNPGTEPSLAWLQGNVADVTGSATLTPGSQPTEETPEPSRPEGQKISDTEVEEIISWGLRYNRTPEDIQNDVDERNQTLGGSGTVPLPVKLRRIVYEPVRGEGAFSVTVTEEEAQTFAEVTRVLDRVSEIQAEMKKLETESCPSITQRVIEVLGGDIIKQYAGILDMLAMARDMRREIQRDGSIDFTYQRPKGRYSPLLPNVELPESMETDRQWQASENGQKAAAEKARVVAEFQEAMQNALRRSGVPYDHPSVTVLNRETLRLNGIIGRQNDLMLEMKTIGRQYNIPELREKRREIESRIDQRARRGEERR